MGGFIFTGGSVGEGGGGGEAKKEALTSGRGAFSMRGMDRAWTWALWLAVIASPWLAGVACPFL